MPRNEPTMDTALLVEGKRFKLLKEGCQILGMRQDGPGWTVLRHSLNVGDILTCQGLVSRWTEGAGLTYGWTVPGTEGWTEPEFYPSGRTGATGPMVPWRGYLEPVNELREAQARLDAIVEAAMTSNEGRLPQADAAINQASLDVILGMQLEHAEAWLGRVKLNEAQTADLVRWEPSLSPYGYDVVLPRPDPAFERLVRLRHNSRAAGTEGDNLRVRRNFKHVRETGGVALVWT